MIQTLFGSFATPTLHTFGTSKVGIVNAHHQLASNSPVAQLASAWAFYEIFSMKAQGSGFEPPQESQLGLIPIRI